MRENVGSVKLGSIVGAFFGGLWFYYASFLTFPRYRLADAVTSIVLAVAFAVIALSRSPRGPLQEQGADPRQRRRLFTVVVIAEVVAINVAWNLLLKANHAEYLVAAVAIIVGLHFVPLARIFHDRTYYLPAIVMTAAGVLAALTGWNTIACLACAIALWAAVSVRRAAEFA